MRLDYPEPRHVRRQPAQARRLSRLPQGRRAHGRHRRQWRGGARQGAASRPVERKAPSVAEAPEAALLRWAEENGAELLETAYAPHLLEGAAMVFAATDDEAPTAASFPTRAR
jgi:hypothetical protein